MPMRDDEYVVEKVQQAEGLGRQLVLDGRSLQYMIDEREVHDVEWHRNIPILDQSKYRAHDGTVISLGSCVGNAGTGLLGTDPFTDLVALPEGTVLDEQFAVEQAYSPASRLDPFPGWFNPAVLREDTGSSGLGLCRAFKRMGLIDGYRWARTVRGLATLLQDGPVAVGSYWYRSMFDPDANGFVVPGGPMDGGHEYVAAAVEGTRDLDPLTWVFTFANSWTESWGDAGHFRMTGQSLERLRDGRDFKQFTVTE